MPRFRPPTRNQPFTRPVYGTPSSLFGRLSFPTGVTVWKDAAGWSSQENPTVDQLAAALPLPDTSEGEEGQYVFLGGHEYQVSDAVAAELTAAGFVVG